MPKKLQQIEREQLRQQLNAAGRAAAGLQGGDWIRRCRKALGMSGAALSKRLGGSRSQAANLERYEREERLSLRSMREAAEALGCRFVYAIVPPGDQSMEDLIEARAEQRARELLQTAAGHMALEAQSLSVADSAAELRRLTDELMRKPPRDFWDPAD